MEKESGKIDDFASKDTKYRQILEWKGIDSLFGQLNDGGKGKGCVANCKLLSFIKTQNNNKWGICVSV